jgi:hypothetical protein
MPAVPALSKSRFFLILALLLSSFSLLTASQASAAPYTHEEELEFNTGCEVTSMAADSANEYIYTFCAGGTIRRFNFDGTPATFSASEPYLENNVITYNPVPNAEPKFGSSGGTYWAGIGVDNSNGPNAGMLIVPGQTEELNIANLAFFEPSGKLVAAKVFDFGSPDAVDVDSNGNIYGFRGNVQKFDQFFRRTEILFSPELPPSHNYGRVDGREAVWTERFNGLVKYEPEAWSDRVDLFFHPTATDFEEAEIERPAPISPYLPPNGLTMQVGDFDVEPGSNDVIVGTGNGEVRSYTEGTAAEPAHEDAPRFTAEAGINVSALTVDDSGDVYVAPQGGSKILKFRRANQLASAHTDPADPEAVGHESATVRGSIDPAPGNAVTECRIAYSPNRLEIEQQAPGTLYEESVENEETEETETISTPTESCTPDPFGTHFTTATSVSATLSGLTTNTTYWFRVEARDERGWVAGATRSFSTVAVLKLNTLSATAITGEGATLNASFDPDGEGTEYWFEYGLDASYGLETAKATLSAGTGVTHVSLPVEGLPAGHTFHYRVFASNGRGTSEGQDMTFRTTAAPEISGTQATDLTGSSATLNARIDPVGSDTNYRFEYGSTASYGRVVPVPDKDIGTSVQEVSQRISGLEPNQTYHFRVTATNQRGTTVSPDATFDFEPPLCPNALVRQETHGSFLPDCRAYELVSPADAGSVLMLPGDSMYEISMKAGRAGKIWTENTGLATNPPRFSYFAGFGAVKGTEPSNYFMDFYLSTRTANGWVTTLPGLKGNEALIVAGTRCSADLSVCIDHNDGNGLFGETPNQAAAEMWDANGTHLGMLPSNISEFPEYEYEPSFEENGFAFGSRMDEQLSGDGKVYAFSSRHVFAPGGMSDAPGSAYVDNIATGEVEPISYLPGSGEPIPQEGSDENEFIEIPGISKDGSHILMSVQGADGPSHLYMRVGGGEGKTYDVSGGHGVTYLGMTSDGKIVDFAATQRLTSEDNDNSTDIYQWRENGGAPKLTLVSQGNENGDTDECSPVGFGSLCSALPLNTERGRPFGWLSTPPLDSPLAEGSGDVLFYSPENLDPGNPGVKNQRNLYEYHEGAAHLVAALEPGTQVSRIQISPNGDHVGLLTASNLTGYDSRGRREMYTYDADTGKIRCASCRPDGLPPVSTTTASQSGPFMSNDGRVFFNTREELSNRDVDGRITDVYEFVNGRPQLISSGTASRDATAASELRNIANVPHAATVGLESVSADGNDVFFSTYDSLVPQDENGALLKFYDARTGGGFPVPPTFAGCEAADECHNEGTHPPEAPVIGTEAQLGSTGNAIPGAKRKKHGRRHHRKHHHNHHHKRHARAHRIGGGRRG